MKKDDVNVERVALNAISEGVAIGSVQENAITIDFVNRAMLDLLRLEQNDFLHDTLLKHIDNEEEVTSNILQCVTDMKSMMGKKVIFRFGLGNLLPLSCDILPFKNGQFSLLMKKANEREKYLDIFSECGVLGGVYEYKRDVGEINCIYCTKKDDSLIGMLNEPGNDMKVWEKYFDEVLASQRKEINLEIQVKESQYARVKIRQLWTSSEGNPVMSLAIQDISEAKLFEQECMDKKRKFEEMNELYSLMKAFFDNSLLMMGTIDLIENDTDMVFVLLNERAASIYKMKSEEIRGKRLSEVTEGNTKELVEFWSQKFRECEAKGGSMPIEFGKNTMFSSLLLQISKNRFCFLSQDITHRKELEERLRKQGEELEATVAARTKQLEEALEVKSRFLATMSHEIRTPLSGLTGTMSILSESQLSEEQRENVKVMEVCGQQLLAVIDDILDLSKLEAHKMTLEQVPLDLHSTLEDALEVVAFEAEKKQLELLCDFDSSLPKFIKGDCVRIRQILVNLLSNACKFSNCGNVVLKAKANPISNQEVEITISVSDQGIGIAEAAKSKLFQPFTQADSSTTRKFGGSGLGLAISKHLCELMKGSMGFESTEGRGSVFHFTIISELSPSIAPNTFPEHVTQKRIFIVDNNEEVLQVLKNLLTMWTFHVSTFQHIEDVAASQIPPDLILIDSKQNQSLISELSTKYKVVITGYSNPFLHTNNLNFSSSKLFIKKPIRRNALYSILSIVFLESVQRAIPKVEEKKRVPSKLKILVAEDNEMNQRVIKKLLQFLGYENFDVVENGKQAIEAVMVNDYGLVFMDIMMPVMGGLEATKHIRTTLGRKELVIIALTADVLLEDQRKYLASGFDNVVTKPIKREHLENVLRSVSLKVL